MRGVWRRRSDRRRWLVEAIVGVSMLPVSVLPLWLYLSHSDDGYLMYLRGRYQLYPPATPSLPKADRAAVAAEGRRRVHGVPVLVYHGIGRDFANGDSADRRFVVPRRQFAEQMRALQAAGFRAITTRQLARYLSGANAVLPPRPVLITFDDGRFDAMVQADPILRDTGMRATMFVIGHTATSGSFYYEQADALRRYARSRRWELEAHTYDLHHLVGTTPALVSRDPGETLLSYRRRVAADLARADSLLRSLSGVAPDAFAYPFGDWGQREPAIAAVLRDVLRNRYPLAFDQDGQSGWRFTMVGDDPLHLHRLEVQAWNGREFLARIEKAARLSDTVYAERGLDASFTPRQLTQAARAQVCARPSTLPVRSVPTGGRKLVALSFDDGPSPFTAEVVTLLQRAHAHATFFLIGSQIGGKERLLRRMLVAGDELGDHTWTHPHLGGLSPGQVRDQLARTARAIERAVPAPPCLARAPYGGDTAKLARAAARLSMSTALWSVDPSDYTNPSPRTIARRTLARVQPGAIVVLHDGGDAQRWRTVQALPAILAGLQARGYRIVTVSELLAASGSRSR